MSEQAYPTRSSAAFGRHGCSECQFGRSLIHLHVWRRIVQYFSCNQTYESALLTRGTEFIARKLSTVVLIFEY